MPRSWLLLSLLACHRDDDAKVRHGAPDAAPGEDFLTETTVRLTSPGRGEVVGSPLTAAWQAGADVASVRLDADGETVWGPVDASAGSGSLEVVLGEGRVTLSLVGLDADGEALSDYSIPVKVSADGASWVSFASPSDGAELPNPITFALDGSDDIDEIQVEADGWPLGTVTPGETLTYEFSGTGYAREITAYGYVDGALTASDTISVVVEPESAPDESSFSDLVVRLLERYPTDGSHDYYWPSGGTWYGTTKDIYYQDELVAEGDPEGRCYCVGLTWEVYMTAFAEADGSTGGDGTLNGMDVSDLSSFRVDWFVRDLWGDGVVTAMENYGLGDPVTDLADLRPGDFLQFWRYSGSGHSVIFIDWELDDDGDIVGIQYWSTQSSTDGIDYNSEYFGTGGSSIDPSYFFAARARMPADWGPWR